MLIEQLLELSKSRHLLVIFSQKNEEMMGLNKILTASGIAVFMSETPDDLLIPSVCQALLQQISNLVLITNNPGLANLLPEITCLDVATGKKLSSDGKLTEGLLYSSDHPFYDATLTDFKIQPFNKIDLLFLLEQYHVSCWQNKLIYNLSTEEKIAQAQRRGYQILKNEKDFFEWLSLLYQSKLMALDTETTGLDIITSEMIGLSMAIAKDKAVYIPFLHQDPDCLNQLNREWVLSQLKPIFENPDYLKIGHNIKFDINILANHGIHLKGVSYDTMIEAYICDTTLPYYNLSYLANHLLSRATIEYEEIAGKGKQQIPFQSIPVSLAGFYSAEDSELTWLLHQKIYPNISSNSGLEYVLTQIEMPLVSILADMERYGVLVDKSQLVTQGEALKEQIDQSIRQIYEIAGEEFNLNSTKQLQMILYDKLKLPIYRKTAKGQVSTSEEILLKLSKNHPIANLIMTYRELSKLKSTFIDSLIAKIHPVTHRIHTSFNQTMTLTGRLSSSNPNLQNIPIRNEEGKRIRKAFIAPEGSCLITADYSQIELRIMAQLSQDPALIHAFQSDQDIHRATASEIFNTPLDQVTEQQRSRAKAVNFGLIYGMSVYGLSQQLSISHAESRRYIDTYFSRYPSVLEFIEHTKSNARELGYVTTYFGRRIYIADLDSHLEKKKQAAERIAVNAPIQGTAADIIKLAMIKVTQRLKKNFPNTHLILQVHDELVFETSVESSSLVMDLIQSEMMSVAHFDIPLTLSIESSSSWCT